MGGTNPEHSLARTKEQGKTVQGNVITSLMKELVGAPKTQVLTPFQGFSINCRLPNYAFNPFTSINQKIIPYQPLKRKNSEIIGEKGRRQREQEGMRVSANSCLKAKCSNASQKEQEEKRA